MHKRNKYLQQFIILENDQKVKVVFNYYFQQQKKNL